MFVQNYANYCIRDLDERVRYLLNFRELYENEMGGKYHRCDITRTPCFSNCSNKYYLDCHRRLEEIRLGDVRFEISPLALDHSNEINLSMLIFSCVRITAASDTA